MWVCFKKQILELVSVVLKECRCCENSHNTCTFLFIFISIFFILNNILSLFLLINKAVMSSDIAIAQFRYLERLLLVHGHWCYRRISSMVLCLLHSWISILWRSYKIYRKPLIIWSSVNLFIVYVDRYAIFSTRISHLVSLYSCMRCMHLSPASLHTMTGFWLSITSSFHHFP